MGSVITGKYPNKHGMRDPYSYLIGPAISGILKKNGYKTAGFVGNGLLSKNHGFAEGFDFYNESSEETSCEEANYKEYPNQVKKPTNYGKMPYQKFLDSKRKYTLPEHL